MAREWVRAAVFGALTACGAAVSGEAPEPPPEAPPRPLPPRPEPRSGPDDPPVLADPIAEVGAAPGSLIPELDNPVEPGPRPAPEGVELAARYASVELAGTWVARDGRRLDLAEREGRIDAVKDCMAARPDDEACDLRAWAPRATWMGAPDALAPSAWIDAGLLWRDTGTTCQLPASGPCYQRVAIDALTGSCVPDGTPQCRRGRPFEDRVASLSGDARTAAAAAWARVALEEHASIAAFARHTLELMSVGAPLDLVEAATRAQADEVRHARQALALAHRFGAVELAFGPLDVAAPPRGSLADVLEAVAREGCVGETLAAVEAAAALEGTSDAEVREVLAGIVADESTHAALAWRTLAWGLPRLAAADRARVLAALDEGAPAPGPEVPDGIGVLGGRASADALGWGLRAVVAPARRALGAMAV